MKLQRIQRIYQNAGLSGVLHTIFEKIGISRKNKIADVWDTYMSWLSFANAGMLDRGNVACFDYAIRNIPTPDPIVEIGSFCGLSTNMLTYCKWKHGVKNTLISCDKWIFEGSEDGNTLGSSSISHIEYREFIKDTFIRNIRMFSRNDLPYTIELISDEFFASWRDSRKECDVLGRPIQLGGPIAFCYIDGNHTYEFVKRDFNNCDEFLVSGGFLLFDDSADYVDFEVCKVVREVINTGRYELIAKNPNYFFKKK